MYPTSLAALGDSLTVAFGATGGGDAPAESWATGTDPAVLSHRQRLEALGVSLSGVWNDAADGQTMADLAGQAATAGGQGAAYVTVWAGTNDVCVADAASMTSVDAFTAALGAVLDRLQTDLPAARVLVLSIPDWYGFWQRNHRDPAAVAAWTTYASRCRVLLDPGATRDDQKAFKRRIDDLNRAIAATCRDYAACETDRKAVFRLWKRLGPADVAADWIHLSPAGQAAVAAATFSDRVFR